MMGSMDWRRDDIGTGIGGGRVWIDGKGRDGGSMYW